MCKKSHRCERSLRDRPRARTGTRRFQCQRPASRLPHMTGSRPHPARCRSRNWGGTPRSRWCRRRRTSRQDTRKHTFPLRERLEKGKKKRSTVAESARQQLLTSQR